MQLSCIQGSLQKWGRPKVVWSSSLHTRLKIWKHTQKTLLRSYYEPHKWTGWHRGCNVQPATSTVLHTHEPKSTISRWLYRQSKKAYFFWGLNIYSYCIFHKLKFIFLTKLFYCRHINHLHIQSLKVLSSLRENILRPKEHLRKWSLW